MISRYRAALIEKILADSHCYSVLPKQFAAIHFVRHIADVVGDAVSDDDIGLLFELREVVHHSGPPHSIVGINFIKRSFAWAVCYMYVALTISCPG